MSHPAIVTISVTQEHINAGIKESCRACPLALAIRERVSGPSTVSVSLEVVNINIWTGPKTSNTDWSHHSCILPFNARQFILGFDAGQPVEPFSFDLYDPLGLLSREEAHP